MCLLRVGGLNGGVGVDLGRRFDNGLNGGVEVDLGRRFDHHGRQLVLVLVELVLDLGVTFLVQKVS